ncbi:DUF1885 family protein [Bacillus carboniphilus]|uniref:DUF1885 family protein n=1 Tax=Bacillus carboniphilus TaxID=86663 RepID=A0ABY9JV64_9BACI|nr:DUF1885 family protein [Bacillus carboniphilus]WLR43296.1 DUF1885 family protein [Bacillus carboniphilus]
MQQSYIMLCDHNETVTINKITELLHHYKEITNKLSKQLNWEYEPRAFPYTIKISHTDQIILEATSLPYKKIFIELSPKRNQTGHMIQFTLTEESTFADKGKANELIKIIGKKLKGKIVLFNGRTIRDYM